MKLKNKDIQFKYSIRVTLALYTIFFILLSLLSVVLLVGQKKALFTAISKTRKGKRNTLLAKRMQLYYSKLTSQSLPAAETPMRKAS